MKVVLLTLLISINLYSPFSVAVPIGFNLFFAFIAFLNSGNNVIFSKLHKIALGLSILLFCWVIIVSIANDVFDDYVIGKFFRTFLNTLLLAIIFKNLNFNSSQFFKAIIIALMLNTVVVYIQILFPSSKELFIGITGFSKKKGILRSFGLFSSYDFAGLTTCITMVVLWLGFLFKKKNFFFVLYFIVLLSSLSISRFTMVVSVLVFMGSFYYFYRKKGNYFIKYLVLFPLISFVGYYTFNKFYAFINFSLNSSSNEDINQSYSTQSTDILLNKMAVLPQDVLSTILGTAKSIDSSDIGYVKIIFMIGIVGLMLILYFYYSLLKNIIIKINNDVTFSSDDKRYLIILLRAVVLLLILFNSKLLLIYSRGTNDFFLILLFGIERIILNNKNIKI